MMVAVVVADSVKSEMENIDLQVVTQPEDELLNTINFPKDFHVRSWRVER
jgi:hypothetical protein